MTSFVFISRAAAALQSFCNPNARSTMAFVGTFWEMGRRISLQIATVLGTRRGLSGFLGPRWAGY